MPILSVIVPIYNVEAYLRRCLDSLVHQTLTDIEIICVNDGSTDSCVSILEDYAKADSRIVVIHKKNGGLSSARNAGLKISRGEYIAFVDSDDYVVLDAYERALSHMSCEVDYVCFPIQMMGDDIYNVQSCFNYGCCGKIELTPDILMRIDTSACNKVFRRKKIQEWKLEFPEGLKVEDIYFTRLYGLRSARVYIMAERLYNYVIRKGSIIDSMRRSASQGCRHHLQIYEKMLVYLDNNNLLDTHKLFMEELFYSLCRSDMLLSRSFGESKCIFAYATHLIEQSSFHYASECAEQIKLIKYHFCSGLCIRKFGSIVKIKHSKNVIRYKIFGITFFKKKIENSKVYCFLFSFIPLCCKKSNPA